MLAGCTESTQGQPTTATETIDSDSLPPSEPPETGEPSGGEPPSVAIPPRPKDLTLDGVAPCTLFTEAQLTQLKIDREPRARTTDDHYQAPACALSVQTQEPSHDYDVLVITTEGIEPWLAGRRNVDAWLVSVGGFPAVSFKLAGGSGVECSTSVGVAEGQQLLIDLSQSAKRTLTQEQLCQMSEQAAGMALQTLQTVK